MHVNVGRPVFDTNADCRPKLTQAIREALSGELPFNFLHCINFSCAAGRPHGRVMTYSKSIRPPFKLNSGI